MKISLGFYNINIAVSVSNLIFDLTSCAVVESKIQFAQFIHRHDDNLNRINAKIRLVWTE